MLGLHILQSSSLSPCPSVSSLSLLFQNIYTRMCVYICIYIYTHMYVCTCMYTKIYTCYLYTYICIYIYIHTCTRSCRYSPVWFLNTYEFGFGVCLRQMILQPWYSPPNGSSTPGLKRAPGTPVLHGNLKYGPAVPGAPNKSKSVLCMYFMPQSRYFYKWSPRDFVELDNAVLMGLYGFLMKPDCRQGQRQLKPAKQQRDAGFTSSFGDDLR